MSATFIQTASIAVSKGSSFNQYGVSASFGSNNTAGNFIVVGIGYLTSSLLVSTCSDNRGNVYTRSVSVFDSTDTAWGEIWHASNIAGGANAVTLSCGTRNMDYMTMVAAEFSGISTSSPFDTGTGSFHATRTVSGSPNINVTNANDLLFGMIVDPTGNNPTITMGSGWTVVGLAQSSGDNEQTQYQNLASTGLVSASFIYTNGDRNICLIGAFKTSTSTTAHNNSGFFRFIFEQ